MTATDTPVYWRIITSFANAFKERGCLDPNPKRLISISQGTDNLIHSLEASKMTATDTPVYQRIIILFYSTFVQAG